MSNIADAATVRDKIEPTEEMIEAGAGILADEQINFSDGFITSYQLALEVFQAMMKVSS